MNREFYEKLYYWEFERHDSIVNSLSLPVGGITLILAVVWYFVSNFYFDDIALIRSISLRYLVVISVFVTMISSVASLLFLALAANGQEYEYLASPMALAEHLESLKEWHRENGSGNYEDSAATDFENDIKSQYMACAEINRRANFLKSRYRYLAHRWLNFAIAALILSVSPIAITLLIAYI